MGQGKKKALEYKTHQSLYEKDRKALAALLLDAKASAQKYELEPEDIERVYNERFGGESMPVNLDAYPRVKNSADNASLM